MRRSYIKDASRLFWDRVASGEDRLFLLRQFAELVIPKKRTSREVRKSFGRRLNRDYIQADEKCFVCGETAAHKHHIVQVQNGGTNMRGNFVPLCRPCHCAVHPWMVSKGVRLS